MKFKKVEISAFRIFDDPQNATFDLTAKSGNAAGFVSLYAPNGFGKTSFYDAVEYGMTKSVDRFYLRAEELEKLANLQSIDKFIRHADSVRNTYVKIYTDSEERPFINTPFDKHGKQRHDLNLDPKKRKEDPFQKVILSQEWVSAFLTESDGEYRYKKFMDIPELTPVNNYYTNLKHLITAYNSKKNELNRRISEYESKVQNIDDSNLLETVNNQIVLLVDQFGDQTLKLLSLSTSQEEIKVIKDNIAGKIDSSSREVLLNQLLDNISVAKSGNESIVGINTFFLIVDTNKNAKARLSEIKSLLDKFELQDRLNAKTESSKAMLAVFVSDKAEATKAITDFVDYERVARLLAEKNMTTTQLQQTLTSINSQLENLNRVEIEKRNQLEAVLRKLEDLKLKKAGIPSKKVDSSDLTIQFEVAESQLNDIKLKIERNNEGQINNQIAISSAEKTIEGISQGVYPQISEVNNGEHISLIQRLKDAQQVLLTEKNQSNIVALNIEQHQTLNITIADFIKAGLVIVNERQTKQCPLCEHDYDSYNDLVQKITDNKALDESLKVLLSQKSAIDLRVAALSNQIRDDENILLTFYKEQLSEFSEKKQGLTQLLDRLKSDANGIEANLAQLRQKRESYTLELEGLSFDEFEEKLDKSIEESEKLRDEIRPNATENKNAIDLATEQLGAVNNQLELIKIEIEGLKSNTEYLRVINWFSKNFTDLAISRDSLVQKETLLTADIRDIVDQQRKTEEDITALNKELASLRKENLVVEKEEMDKLSLENDAKLTSYRYFLKDKLGIIVEQLDATALSEELEEKRLSYNAELNQLKRLQEEYQKLNRYSENVWPFLQSENAKLELTEAKGELNFLIQNVEPALNEERNKAKEYLETRIKNFFHEDLINTLYKKIDPHPDFKFVQFKANFDADIPRLDVFVKNTKNEESLIPNLYFSTAQINILSLSIFLATALNSKEYQCIFIDDPIQSMDSINVLSTIDLLRSLVVNEGKQIILSTHDANFHNLLKMKMPDDLFESRFLELESFGKVKPSN